MGRIAGRVGEAAGATRAGDGAKRRPGSLILLRCGESEWTRDGRFVGWADPDLVPEGVLQVEHAGR